MNRKGEQGSILILLAVGMTAFLVLLGFVTDVGFLYIQRSILANTADASALAGAQELPGSPQDAYARAIEYGTANRAEAGELAVLVSPNGQQITVEASRQVDLFFMRIIGWRSARVSALARAEVAAVNGVRGIVPFGIVEDNFQYGQSYYLKFGPGIEDAPYRGNFGALALGGTGGNTYRDNIRFGYDGMIRVGDVLPTEPGNMSGPTQQGVEHRIAASPYCSWTSRHVNCSRVVIVPVIDSLDVHGRDQVTVVGFAAFFLEDAGSSGNESFVRGRFIEMAVDGEVGEGGNFGLQVVRLIN